MFDIGHSLGGKLKAGVRIMVPLTGSFVGPDGMLVSPDADGEVPDVKAMKIGPPWPDEIKSEAGALPEFVVVRDGKWVAYAQDDSGERNARASRRSDRWAGW